MIKFKKTTAALLVAGLTVAGSSYAWANEAIFKSPDEQKDVSSIAEKDSVVTMYPSNNESEVTLKTENYTSPEYLEERTKGDTKVKTAKDVNEESKKENENTTEATKDNEVSKNEFPKIPEGYSAGNLAALKQAYENAGSENAKQAILKNAHKAIAKFEAKQGSKEAEKKAEIKVELEYIGIINPGETIITPVQKETLKNTAKPTVVPSTETTVQKDNQLSTKDQQKAEKKALKEQHKEEKKSLKAEHKADKKKGKDKE